ncbi:hypothetical protein LXL04_035345 [Taraxacum kok-saghyz]
MKLFSLKGIAGNKCAIFPHSKKIHVFTFLTLIADQSELVLVVWLMLDEVSLVTYTMKNLLLKLWKAMHGHLFSTTGILFFQGFWKKTKCSYVHPDVQRFRCLANFEALRFPSPLSTMGETLVSRMKERSKVNGGKYISVHLRFQEFFMPCGFVQNGLPVGVQMIVAAFEEGKIAESGAYF